MPLTLRVKAVSLLTGLGSSFGLGTRRWKRPVRRIRMKPEIHEAAIGRSTHGAFRGGRGRRAGTDQTGTWETRQGGSGDTLHRLQEYITGVLALARSRRGS